MMKTTLVSLLLFLGGGLFYWGLPTSPKAPPPASRPSTDAPSPAPPLPTIHPVASSALVTRLPTIHPVASSALVTRLAFGSCAHQAKPQPIWSSVLAFKPEVFLFLGDNVYGDTQDMDVLKAKYALLGSKPGFQALKKQARILATWDDHDYGENDAGSEYPKKQESKTIFLDFFGEPPASPRRQREGIYEAYTFGPKDKLLQIILLDLRTFRSPLTKGPMTREKEALHIGPYLPQDDPNATMLGPAQWSWLETILAQPASFRIIATSIPFLSKGTGWETWDTMPKQRDRLLALLKKHKISNLLFVSGDTHWAELSSFQDQGQPPLYDLTSSGLTEVWEGVAPNDRRLGKPYLGENFGSLTFRWLPTPRIQLAIHALDGRIVLSKEIP